RCWTCQCLLFFFQAEDGIRAFHVTGVQTCALPIYTPSLLYPIPRQPIWEGLGLDPQRLPFHGADVWNSYEVSWLTPSGKPEVAVVEFVFPLTPSSRIVESKSFKLYLNSFNQTVFSDRAEVLRTLESDLSVTAQAPVLVRVQDTHRIQQLGIAR